ncbi:hypothetical protein RRG08_057717 [Elysia crispata]|uniref:Uncharacterized protein n=1 Tax=Elysia crispata TaxID=231223 RepID=A0AAE0ZDY1_9GAST|nr:hypothetical protein RRG08_057717 [Elysia crispata]
MPSPSFSLPFMTASAFTNGTNETSNIEPTQTYFAVGLENVNFTAELDDATSPEYQNLSKQICDENLNYFFLDSWKYSRHSIWYQLHCDRFPRRQRLRYNKSNISDCGSSSFAKHHDNRDSRA